MGAESCMLQAGRRNCTARSPYLGGQGSRLPSNISGIRRSRLLPASCNHQGKGCPLAVHRVTFTLKRRCSVRLSSVCIGTRRTYFGGAGLSVSRLVFRGRAGVPACGRSERPAQSFFLRAILAGRGLVSLDLPDWSRQGAAIGAIRRTGSRPGVDGLRRSIQLGL